MRIGIGLPTSLPGRRRSEIIDWAIRAEQAGFASLGVIDRVSYDAWEPLAALAGAAAVTDKPRLVTMVLIGPLHNTALLARQAATVDCLSNGRLTLGLGVGARRQDYRAAGIDHRHRGLLLTDQLARLRDHWEDATVGPVPVQVGGPDLLVGGVGGAAMLRMARLADGYVHGGVRPGPFCPPRSGPGLPGKTSDAPAPPNCGRRPTSGWVIPTPVPPTCATTTRF